MDKTQGGQDSDADDDPRMSVRIKLEKALSYEANEPEAKLLEGKEKQLKTAKQLASEIEEVLYNKLKEKRDYAHQSRSILTNLRDAENRDFKRSVRVGFFQPEQMATLTTNDMASDEKRVDTMEGIELYYDKKRPEVLKFNKVLARFFFAINCPLIVSQIGVNLEFIFNRVRKARNYNTYLANHLRLQKSSTFACGKCGSKHLTYYQLQTHSSDEPMTTFVTCMTCNNRCKFSEML
ncbi:unnamed protein product [Amoebophrya sp. A25]|nr:unnamed protein product [Amoebophrya sp. A25]|eukprot:GSA25T00016445001.1